MLQAREGDGEEKESEVHAYIHNIHTYTYIQERSRGAVGRSVSTVYAMHVCGILGCHARKVCYDDRRIMPSNVQKCRRKLTYLL